MDDGEHLRRPHVNEGMIAGIHDLVVNATCTKVSTKGSDHDHCCLSIIKGSSLRTTSNEITPVSSASAKRHPIRILVCGALEPLPGCVHQGHPLPFGLFLLVTLLWSIAGW